MQPICFYPGAVKIEVTLEDLRAAVPNDMPFLDDEEETSIMKED